jgi:molecular chaperone GrpE
MARRERDDYYERLLRQAAEFDNYRKRTERERREMAQYAAGDLLETLLPVVDDFERALQAEAGSDAAAYRKGVELIYKQLQDLLAKRGVTPIEAVGAPFDPRFHQAVTYEPSPGHAEGEVLEVVRRGYMHGDRLLRPAMVKVARA